MSLSNFVYNTARDIHRANPFMALAVATSYGISKVASTYITRFTLPAPADAAKFTAAAIVATFLFSQIAKWQAVDESSGFADKSSRFASLGITLFSFGLALNYAFNPEKTILSFAKHMAIFLPTFLPALLFRPERTDNIEMSMDKVLLSSVQEVIKNCHKTVLAGGAAWLISSKLGSDRIAFTAFTVALSVLVNLTRPVFETFEQGQEGNGKYPGRIIPLILMAKGTSDYLKLDCPLYIPFIKTTAVAAGIIALLDLPGKLIESQSEESKDAPAPAARESRRFPAQQQNPSSYHSRGETNIRF